MPGQDQIPHNANEFIEQQLDTRLSYLEGLVGADALSFSGPIYRGVDDFFRDAVEKKREKRPRKNKLMVVLNTTGGYIEVVHRIVDTLRRHYKFVEFIIPNYAYSAGTILAMSGDEIHMDYYSRLGPIDPQVQNNSGKWVGALRYLDRYNRLMKKADEGKINLAEIQLLLHGFDEAELDEYEHARELSIKLLTDWLVKYKFRNWKETRTRKQKVTPSMRKERASKIAAELNDTKRWHSHGYGIAMDVLQKDRNLKLLINDFGKNKELDKAIKLYHKLLEDYMGKRGHRGLIHTVGQYNPFMF